MRQTDPSYRVDCQGSALVALHVYEAAPSPIYKPRLEQLDNGRISVLRNDTSDKVLGVFLRHIAYVNAGVHLSSDQVFDIPRRQRPRDLGWLLHVERRGKESQRTEYALETRSVHRSTSRHSIICVVSSTPVDGRHVCAQMDGIGEIMHHFFRQKVKRGKRTEAEEKLREAASMFWVWPKKIPENVRNLSHHRKNCD